MAPVCSTELDLSKEFCSKGGGYICLKGGVFGNTDRLRKEYCYCW